MGQKILFLVLSILLSSNDELFFQKIINYQITPKLKSQENFNWLFSPIMVKTHRKELHDLLNESSIQLFSFYFHTYKRDRKCSLEEVDRI